MKVINNQKIKDKFDIPIRWVVGNICINYFTKKGKLNKRSYTLKSFGKFPIDESNIGTLILVCCAIEFYGRLMLGYRNQFYRGITEQTFIAFTSEYLGQVNNKYKKRSRQLLNKYRNSLVHSYVLGYKSNQGFFPTRGRRQYYQNHLDFIPKTKRLVINVDKFVKDFIKALEFYYQDVKNNTQLGNIRLLILRDPKRYPKLKRFNTIKLRKNAFTSLKDF